MTDNAFDLIDQALRSGGPEAGFDLLAQRVLREKNYPLLFEVRLLKKRHELGLPLIQVDDSAAMPPDTRREYDKAFIDAAREVGGLFLGDGNIQRASPRTGVRMWPWTVGWSRQGCHSSKVWTPGASRATSASAARCVAYWRRDRSPVASWLRC
jgi:hypothetical protein